jgi:UDP-N-acetylglucosamine 2-epimerase (non-hydrolysing)
MTILGTRPEIIRLSQVIPKLDDLCEHVLVHTGQNYDPALSDVFFEELGLRAPDHYLGVKAQSYGDQVGRILIESEKILVKDRPDRLLVLGDTNSGLSSVIAKRMGIPVYHMEAGNRCYDDRVPEEINRRIIDHCSDVLMPYTERSRVNLLREGIAGPRIYVTGNPILEVINHYAPQIDASTILKDLGLTRNEFFLVTMHRAENVDIPERLSALANAFNLLHEAHGLPIIISTHPHTRERMEAFGIEVENEAIRFLPPFGFFDFVRLERSAYCLLTDSGTVQEECCILKIPNVTIRDVTERPETVECGSNILSGVEPSNVLRCVSTVTDSERNWTPPAEYLVENVSNTVIKILLGYDHSF